MTDDHKNFIAVARKTGVKKEELLEKNKSKRLVDARRLYVLLMRKDGHSFSRIARDLNMDHSSMIHAYREAQKDSKLLDLLKHVRGEREQWNALSLRPQLEFLSKGMYSNIYEFYKNKCVVCGFSEIIEVHHIIPRRSGGSDDVNNLIVLCPNHHALAERGMLKITDIHLNNELSTD